MARVILFHHALGLTEGVRAFAEELRRAGHEVETPDLYDGRTFRTVSDGVAFAEEIGLEVMAERGVRIAERHGASFVVAGFSLGVLPTQKAAQTLPGAAGAILYHGAVPASVFGEAWPGGVPLQMHLAEHDTYVAEDIEAARDLATLPGAELFIYPTGAHLVADSSSPDYDAAIALTILERTLVFLADLED